MYENFFQIIFTLKYSKVKVISIFKKLKLTTFKKYTNQIFRSLLRVVVPYVIV
jgi:hypothetical protein